MHEVVFSDDRQSKLGVRTGDLAKRLIDYGFHPYTVSFPTIVHGAIMIEPTETESLRETRSLFIDAMISIAKEIEEDPKMVLQAPYWNAHHACRRSHGRPPPHCALEAEADVEQSRRLRLLE